MKDIWARRGESAQEIASGESAAEQEKREPSLFGPVAFRYVRCNFLTVSVEEGLCCGCVWAVESVPAFVAQLRIGQFACAPAFVHEAVNW